MRIILVLFLVAFSASASDLIMNFTYFSDDGGQYKLSNFKIDGDLIVENSALSCSFRGIESEEFIEFNVINLNGVYIASASESAINSSSSRNGATISKKFDDIFAAYDSGDGYVSRSLLLGSRGMIQEYINLINMYDIQEDQVELANIKALELDEVYEVKIQGESYEATCELELEEDL